MEQCLEELQRWANRYNIVYGAAFEVKCPKGNIMYSNHVKYPAGKKSKKVKRLVYFTIDDTGIYENTEMHDEGVCKK